MREHRSRASRTINLGPKVIYTQQCDISCWFDARRAERFFSAHCITTILLARAIMLRELPLITLRINLRGALFFLAINSLVSRPRALSGPLASSSHPALLETIDRVFRRLILGRGFTRK